MCSSKEVPSLSGRRAGVLFFAVQLVIALFLPLGFSGCQTTTHVIGQADAPSTRVQTKVTGAHSYADNSPVSADDAVGTDPCEMRLQNIEAALLLYYSVNRQLPPRLEDLVSLSSGDLDLTCPVSHKEYLYTKEGIVVPSSPKRIIVSDATAAHDGKRWCIFMDPPAPGAALVLEPREVPDAVFGGYQPSH